MICKIRFDCTAVLQQIVFWKHAKLNFLTMELLEPPQEVDYLHFFDIPLHHPKGVTMFLSLSITKEADV